MFLGKQKKLNVCCSLHCVVLCYLTGSICTFLFSHHICLTTAGSFHCFSTRQCRCIFLCPVIAPVDVSLCVGMSFTWFNVHYCYAVTVISHHTLFFSSMQLIMDMNIDGEWQ